MRCNEIQIGMVFTNFLICTLADAYEMHVLMLNGALFHAFMPSFILVLRESLQALGCRNWQFWFSHPFSLWIFRPNDLNLLQIFGWLKRQSLLWQHFPFT